jgi:transglutaminase/protease-like cytokinesis protein 3
VSVEVTEPGGPALPVKTFRPKHATARRPGIPEPTLVEEVAADLAKSATTESQKAAAIYYWITHYISYDDEAYASGRFGDQSPESVIEKGKAVCGGYAALFVELARAMGLESKMVTGRAIGLLARQESRASVFVPHAWNAVRVDGQWSLCDATWGAKGAPLAQRGLSRRQEYYFQTPPGRMIYDHFPDDSRWQLLDKPVTWEQCLRMPRLKPPFFICGLAMSAPEAAVLEVEKSDRVLLSVRESVDIVAQLSRDGGGKVADGVEVERHGGECRIRVRPPEPGLYLFTVWCKSANSGGAFEDALELVVERKR